MCESNKNYGIGKLIFSFNVIEENQELYLAFSTYIHGDLASTVLHIVKEFPNLTSFTLYSYCTNK